MFECFSQTVRSIRYIIRQGVLKLEMRPQTETEFEVFTGESDDQLMFVKDETVKASRLFANWDTSGEED